MKLQKTPIAFAFALIGAAPLVAQAAPTVSFTKPDAGAIISRPINQSSACEVTGTDIKRVVFSIVSSTGSTTALNTEGSAPWNCNIDPRNFPSGQYTLRAVAYDATSGGPSATATRSVTLQNGTTIGGPTVSFKTPSESAAITKAIRQSGGSSAIAPSDILSSASADFPFAEQSGYTAQVIKTYTPAQKLAESGIHGATLPDGETLRFGKVADPTNAIRKALAFQVHTSDPITSSGKRSELSITPNIEMNKVYWIAFSAFVYDWGTLDSRDNALFGTQVHTGDNDAKVGGPSLALVTTQNGRKFQVYTRYSESSTPSSSNSVSRRHAAYDIPFGRWADFVIKFKHNTSGNGFLQAWMDGKPIANYTGSLGYNTGMADYAKFGYYNWSRTRMGPTVRKVLLRSPTIVVDPTGSKYSQEQVRTLLGAAVHHARRGR